MRKLRFVVTVSFVQDDRELQIAPWSALHSAQWARLFLTGSSQCSLTVLTCFEEFNKHLLSPSRWWHLGGGEGSSYNWFHWKHTTVKVAVPFFSTLCLRVSSTVNCNLFHHPILTTHYEIDKILPISQTGKPRYWGLIDLHSSHNLQIRFSSETIWVHPKCAPWLHLPFSFILFFFFLPLFPPISKLWFKENSVS